MRTGNANKLCPSRGCIADPLKEVHETLDNVAKSASVRAGSIWSLFGRVIYSVALPLADIEGHPISREISIHIVVRPGETAVAFRNDRATAWMCVGE